MERAARVERVDDEDSTSESEGEEQGVQGDGSPPLVSSSSSTGVVDQNTITLPCINHSFYFHHFLSSPALNSGISVGEAMQSLLVEL